jgi:hypothetical protein
MNRLSINYETIIGDFKLNVVEFWFKKEAGRPWRAFR